MPCQLLCLPVRQRFQPNGALVGRIQEILQERTPFRVLAAVTSEQQQSGRIWRPQEGLQQRGTVEVSPLQIVDRQDNRAMVAQEPKQLTKPGEGPAAQLLLIGHLFRSPQRRGHGWYSREDREERNSGPRSRGNRCLTLKPRLGFVR